MSDSFPDERKLYVANKIKGFGKVVAADLAAELNVSIHTVRRDLVELAAAGVCKRVYGGAISLVSDVRSLSDRAGMDPDKKRALAMIGKDLLVEGQCVFMDAGSTNLAIAAALSFDISVTVVTNSPMIAVELGSRKKTRVIVLGGMVEPDVGGVIGASVLAQIKEFSFDLTFLGVCAVDGTHGLTAVNYEDSVFKRSILNQSKKVIVAALNDKVGSVAPFLVSPLEKIDIFILEQSVPRERIAKFLECGEVLFG